MAKIDDLPPDYPEKLRRSACTDLFVSRMVAIIIAAVGSVLISGRANDIVYLDFADPRWTGVALRWGLAALAGALSAWFLAARIYAKWLPDFTQHVLAQLKEGMVMAALEPQGGIFLKIKTLKYMTLLEYLCLSVKPQEPAVKRISKFLLYYKSICRMQSKDAYPAITLFSLQLMAMIALGTSLFWSWLTTSPEVDQSYYSHPAHAIPHGDNSNSFAGYLLVLTALAFFAVIVRTIEEASLRLALAEYISLLRGPKRN